MKERESVWERGRQRERGREGETERVRGKEVGTGEGEKRDGLIKNIQEKVMTKK